MDAISSHSCAKLLVRYLSIIPPFFSSSKPLNPYHPWLHSQKSPLKSPPDPSFHQNPPHRNQLLHQSSSGPSPRCRPDGPPLCQKQQFFHNNPSGSSSKCDFVSSPPQKRHSFIRFSSQSSPECDTDSLQVLRKQIFFPSVSSGECSFRSNQPQEQRMVPNWFGPFSQHRFRFGSLCSVSVLRINNGSLFRGYCAPSVGDEKHYEIEENRTIGCGEVKLEKNDGVVSCTPLEAASEVVEIIKSGGIDMESKLNSIAGLDLPILAVSNVFQVLNCQKVSGLRFFRWIQGTSPKLNKSAELCSLIINHLGWLDDYESMLLLLKEFREKNLCLTEKAFDFLTISSSSEPLLEESVKRLIDCLREAGGSTHNSGICALIKMFCELDLFEMAKRVIQMTERKVTCYNILIREKCKRGCSEEARDIMAEMRELGCPPDVRTYNYVLGSLGKRSPKDEAGSILEEMKQHSTPPDAITFEILIHSLCTYGNLDQVYGYFDRMASTGIQPRLNTHATFIKALFNANRYVEAYRYVTEASSKYECISNSLYSLLAKLYRIKGDLGTALNIMMQMMDKGYKPDFVVYITLVKALQRTGRRQPASDLKNKYSRFETTK